MKLITQPDDGIAPLLKAIGEARDQIAIVIFRFDQRDLEKALAAAVTRGVAVRALIAHTNSDGCKQLRDLELRLLSQGITVSRTADHFVRYHDKLLIIDKAALYVLGFNFTHLDMARSRSFGLVTTNADLVKAALTLFECDCSRQPFTIDREDFIISPLNARERLAALISGARHSLNIYDPKLTDRTMLRLLRDRAEKGVKIRIIGRTGLRGIGLESRKLEGQRLHVRAILKDDHQLFIGSQSLRAVELDHRREAGLIVSAQTAIRTFRDVFERDWCQCTPNSAARSKSTRPTLTTA